MTRTIGALGMATRSLYASLFDNIFDMALDGLLPILNVHGIEIPKYSDAVDARLALIWHIFSGDCCKIEYRLYACCRSNFTVFGNKRGMKDFFYMYVAEHETDLFKVSQICKSLNMIICKCAVAQDLASF